VIRAAHRPESSLSFPFRDEGIEGTGGDCGWEFRVRFGELAMADPIETSLRMPLVAVGEFVAEDEGMLRLNDPFVGVPGREVFDFPPAGEMAASPEPASVSRNSTQSRENDCSVMSNVFFCK
jgi:hypothetical protein